MKISKSLFVSIVASMLERDAAVEKFNEGLAALGQYNEAVDIVPVDYQLSFEKLFQLAIGEDEFEVLMTYMYPMDSSDQLSASELYDIVESTFNPVVKKVKAKKLTVDTVVDAMREGIVRVVFKKADESTRVLYGTLCEEFIPDERVPAGNGNRILSNAVIRAFDTEINEWRSFRKDSFVEATMA